MQCSTLCVDWRPNLPDGRTAEARARSPLLPCHPRHQCLPRNPSSWGTTSTSTAPRPRNPRRGALDNKQHGHHIIYSIPLPPWAYLYPKQMTAAQDIQQGCIYTWRKAYIKGRDGKIPTVNSYCVQLGFSCMQY